MSDHAGVDDPTRPDDPGESALARRVANDPHINVRASDLEPYTGLRYLSTLFRIMAVIIVAVLIVEAVAGLIAAGRDILPLLLANAGRSLVLAGVLWGIGDLAVLLIDIGHDVRASRILVGRQALHHPPHEGVPAATRRSPAMGRETDVTSARGPADATPTSSHGADATPISSARGGDAPPTS